MAGPAGQNGKMTKRDAEVNRTAATRSWRQKRSQSECSAPSIELQKSIFTLLRELVMKFPLEILGLCTAAFHMCPGKSQHVSSNRGFKINCQANAFHIPHSFAFTHIKVCVSLTRFHDGGNHWRLGCVSEHSGTQGRICIAENTEEYEISVRNLGP